MRWCGPEVEVEGIVSIKTGGCPEDCHFCSQSGRFETPVRAVRLDIPILVEAARETAATGATEFCIVAAVRGPDERLMAQVREGVDGDPRRRSRSTSPARSASSPASRASELRDLGVHRYNHNLETARSHFGNVVTTHTWEERWETLQLVREMGMEVCCGGIIGMGETLEQRAELAAQFAALDPDEVPLNFLDPRPGHAVRGPARRCAALDALRTIAAFRLALPRTILRFAGGRELTLGDLGARQGMVGGINAVIVGNYLTTLGRDPQEDLDLLAELSMPVKELARRCDHRGAAAGARALLRGLRAAGCADGAHERCLRPLDPPRFCADCGRKLAVQVLPDRLRGAMRPLPADRPGLHRALRTIESAQGPKVDARRARGAAAVLERLPRAGGRPAAARRRGARPRSAGARAPAPRSSCPAT